MNSNRINNMTTVRLNEPKKRSRHLSLVIRPTVTWTEIGLWLLVLFGAFLGSLKRYVPVPEEIVTIGFDALCFALLGYVLIRRLLHSRKLPYSPITLHLLLFMGFAFMTILNPVLTSFMRGVFGWRFLASGLLFHFLGFYAFDDVRRIRRFLMVFWLVAGIVAIYGIVQLVRGYTAVELLWINNLAATMRIAGTGSYRLMATMGGAVDLSFFMSLTITSLVGTMIWQRRIRTMNLVLLGLMFVAIVFTFVRAAWSAVFIAIIYLLLVNLWHIKWLRPLFPVLGILLLATFIALPLSASSLAPHFENPALRERVASFSNPLADRSMIARFAKWEAIWQVVQEYPLGIGVGMTGSSSLRYSDPSPAPVTMDNSYLKVLVEMGWIGFGLFVWLLFTVLSKGIRLSHKLQDEYRMLAQLLVASFIAFVVLLFFGEYIEINPGRTIVWILSGFLFSLPRLQKQDLA